MLPPSYRSSGPLLTNRAGPATKALLALLLVVSVGGAYLQRSYGFGLAELVFHRERLLEHYEAWRLVSYAFAKATSPFSLLLSSLALYLFGSNFEARYGTRAFTTFFFASTIGAAVIALPLGLACDSLGLFVDRSVFGGPDAAIDAMLVAMALSAPDSPVLFGFVLPMPAKHFLGLVLLLEVIGGIMTGVASLGLTLGGMAMGWLLVTGNWRPRRALDHYRLWRLSRRRRRGLFVVPPKKRFDFNPYNN